MGEGLNRVLLLGNLGQDPELRFTQDGKAVLNIRLATTETYFDREKQKKEQTTWHTVVVWGRRAESLSKILVKGSQIHVEGSIRNSSYDGRDGQKKYKSEISARNIILCGRRPDADGDEAPPAAAPPPAAPADYSTPPDAFGPDDDDIPF